MCAWLREQTKGGDFVSLGTFKDVLRPWVAFSVVDEEAYGRVDAADLKVRLR